MKSYDLCVIGAGSGGLVAATTGKRLGMATAFLEKDKFGGECTHYGCVPSKALIHAAKTFRSIERADRLGLPAFDPAAGVDFGRVMEHVDSVVQGVYEHETPDVFRDMGIDVFVDPGGARFADPEHVIIGEEKIRAKFTIVCTGSRPRSFRPKGWDQVPWLTNANFWDLREKPRSLTFVGGGVISAELGQAMRCFGSDISLIDHNPRILKVLDDDIAEIIIGIFERDGIRLLHDTEVLECERVDSGARVTVKTPAGTEVLDTEALFLAVGRHPNVEGLELDKAGVDYGPHGIKTNEFLQTTAPNIYACGDVASPAKFTHTASYQADLCVHNILNGNTRTNDLSVLPWVIFTDPEIAHVGMNETAARRAGNDVNVLKVATNLDRFVTDGKTDGLLKIMLDGDDKILGAEAVGAHAGEWIHLVSVLMRSNMPIRDFADTIFAYPTFSEIVKKAFVRYLRTK